MRTLVLFRGAPGCGKSTFIQEHGWENYSLSPDKLRLMFRSPVPDVTGKATTSFKSDKRVWNMVYEIAEDRFKRGEFTVIDATNSQTHEMTKWRNLARKYRYRIYLIDMTDISKDTCKYRNRYREEYKSVPPDVIDKFYDRFATQSVPSGITVIKPDEWSKILWHPVDASQFDKVKIIGDIHGCYDVMMDALGEIKPDTLYVFVGDLTDRGDKNAEVVQFFMEHAFDNNFIFIEGNHERYLRQWCSGEIIKSGRFIKETASQLEAAGINKKDLKRCLDNLQQCLWIRIGDKKYDYFISHAGVSFDPALHNPIYIPTEVMINGTGSYDGSEDFAKNMMHIVHLSTQIHGHRKHGFWPHAVSLVGDVENGGKLYVSEFKTKDWNELITQSYINTYYVPKPEPITPEPKGFVDLLRENPGIREKELGNNISSFNFTRDVFRTKDWNDITTKARGLFINTKTGEVVARGYDKFFNLDEVPETKMSTLESSLKFPVTGYFKYNGFLGLLSWNNELNEPMFCSKSTNSGPYVEMFKDQFRRLPESAQNELLDLVERFNVTILFEVLDERDPHIIREGNTLRILDIVENHREFHKWKYSNWIYEFENQALNARCKNVAFTAFNFADLEEWIDRNNLSSNLEGVVIEDSNGFMFKVKTPFYKRWKKNRVVLSDVIKQGYSRTGGLTDRESLEFYKFIREKNVTDRDELIRRCKTPNGVNVITAREWFLKER